VVRTKTEFDYVKQLVAEGLSDHQIAKLTGISQPTVTRWRKREHPPGRPSHHFSWRIRDEYAYCYLLGCYLGDGTVARPSPNSWELRLACDRRYVDIMDEIEAAAILTFHGAAPTTFASSTGASALVRISHPGIGEAFPQHGPGRKHLRRIVLADWQTELTRREPEAFIRGLIHSDGCRVENRFRRKLPSGRTTEYRYIRYFFSNLSADIRNIFVEHCGLLGIRVTQSNSRNLSISHRDSVAILERIVGAKT
jgi:transcriptional regulator with XRE-family HTH domain